MTHAQYMCKLHKQLITLSVEDMYEENTFSTDGYTSVEERESVDASGHVPKLNEEWRDHSGQRKRVQKNCKGTIKSCWDVWHNEYKNGAEIPAHKKGKIRVRAAKTTGSPGKSPAKRRRAAAASPG
ncbi:hypothetical protein PInf_024198 [Phytophthora infestans]|nr:hypothetical protein PInf_024198 [Phytophthora infestans]